MKQIRTTLPAMSQRPAFTLIEIILVLSLMVVMAAIAAPIFRSTLQNERLRKSAELIAADWTRTRAKAMEVGESQVWLCTLSDGTYSAQNASQMSSADASAVVSNATELTATSPGATIRRFGSTMPQGISIQEVTMSEADSLITMSQATVGTDAGSATLFFYPDGTSSSARLTLATDAGRSMTVMLNGMAGTVRVSAMKGTSQ